MWYHIKIKPDVDKVLSKAPFWLGGEDKEDILKILNKKHKITENNVEWIKQKTPPFIGE